MALEGDGVYATKLYDNLSKDEADAREMAAILIITTQSKCILFRYQFPSGCCIAGGESSGNVYSGNVSAIWCALDADKQAAFIEEVGETIAGVVATQFDEQLIFAHNYKARKKGKKTKCCSKQAHFSDRIYVKTASERHVHKRWLQTSSASHF